MTAARRTWEEVLVELNGHLHSEEAKNCQHRPGRDTCRVCCTCADVTRVVEPEPEDSDWRADDRSRAKALVYTLIALNAAVVAILLGALTLAGVIPS